MKKKHLADLKENLTRKEFTKRWAKGSRWNEKQIDEMAKLILKIKKGYELDSCEIDRLKLFISGYNLKKASRISLRYISMAMEYIKQNDIEVK